MTHSVRQNVLYGALFLATTNAIAADPAWIADAKGCKVSNLHPLPNEYVTWSGDCPGGYAEGGGTLSWFLRGKPSGVYRGELKGGSADGHGVYQYPSGARYEGGFVEGRYEGHGVYRYASGSTFEGEFVAGKASGAGTLRLSSGERFETDFMDPYALSRGDGIEGVAYEHYERSLLDGHQVRPPDALYYVSLLNVCVNAHGVYQSVDLIQSSGDVGKDTFAVHAAKVGDVRPNLVDGKPAAACHMEAVLFFTDATAYAVNAH
jgi:hypothetical protein